MEPDKDKDDFGPATMRILDQAYREARRRLQGDKAGAPPLDQTDLAKRIMLLAKTGERNVKRLVEGALAGWRGKR